MRATSPIAQMRRPFPSLIDWSRIMLDVPIKDVPKIVARLLAIPPSEVEGRQKYLDQRAKKGTASSRRQITGACSA